MSVVLEGRAPYERALSYERVISETGEKFSKTGHMIRFDDAVAGDRRRPDPLPVLPPAAGDRVPVRLRGGRAGAAPDRRAVEHRVVLRHVREHRPRRDGRAVDARRPALHVTDRWLLARTAQLVDVATEAMRPRGHGDDGARGRAVHRRGVELVRAREPPAVLARRADDGRRQAGVSLDAVRRLAGGHARAGAHRAVRHRGAVAAGRSGPFADDAAESVHHALWPVAPAEWHDDGAARTRRGRCAPSSAPHCASARRRSSACASPCPRSRSSPSDAERAALLEQQETILAELNVKRVEFAADLSALEEDHLALDFKRAGPVLRNQLDAVLGRDRRAERRRSRGRDRGDPQRPVACGSRAGPTTCRPRSSCSNGTPRTACGRRRHRAGSSSHSTRASTTRSSTKAGRATSSATCRRCARTPASTSATASSSGWRSKTPALRAAVQTHLDTIAGEVLANAAVLESGPADAPRREFKIAGRHPAALAARTKINARMVVLDRPGRPLRGVDRAPDGCRRSRHG